MKILLVDDHALFREGLRYVLQQIPEVDDVVEGENYYDALMFGERFPELELALLDLQMPGSEGPSSIRFFHHRFPYIPVMVISAEDSRSVIQRVLNAGALGYVCKTASAPLLINAVKQVLAGDIYVPAEMSSALPLSLNEDAPGALAMAQDRRRRYTNEYGLTARQMDVLKCIARGLSNREISESMGLAEGTVKIHISGVFHALRVKSRFEAVRIAEQMGLIVTDAYG